MCIEHQCRKLAILAVDTADDIANSIYGDFIKGQPVQFGSYQVGDL